jgi:hypothetical protein
MNDLEDPFAEDLKYRRENIFLITEVSIKAPHRAARLGNNHGNRGRVIARAAEKPGSGLKKSPAACLAAGLGGGSFSVGHDLGLVYLLSRIE